MRSISLLSEFLVRCCQSLMLLQRHRLSVSLNGSLGGHSLVSGLHAPDAWRINGQGQALTAPAWSELDRMFGSTQIGDFLSALSTVEPP